jgi:hypothetical protein
MKQPRRFYVRRHQNKERAFVEALERRGYEATDQRTLIRAALPALAFALFDHDIRRYGDAHGHVAELDEYERLGIPVFMYPHAARPNLLWDVFAPWKHTKTCFVQAPGHVDVMEAIGYPCPVQVVGWSYSPLRPFAPVKPDGKIKVLFAPVHPNANGWLCKKDLLANQAAHEALAALPDVELTVRHIRHLRLSGLKPIKGVTYTQGLPNGDYSDMEAADVIVGHQTYAYIAVALGKPVVMFNDCYPAKSGNSQRVLLWIDKHFTEYRELLRYPYEVEGSCDLLGTLQAAMIGSPAAQTWRERYIGGDFQPDTFVATVERYI